MALESELHLQFTHDPLVQYHHPLKSDFQVKRVINQCNRS